MQVNYDQVDLVTVYLANDEVSRRNVKCQYATVGLLDELSYRTLAEQVKELYHCSAIELQPRVQFDGRVRGYLSINCVLESF